VSFLRERLLAKDPVTGVETYMTFDPATGKTVFRRFDSMFDATLALNWAGRKHSNASDRWKSHDKNTPGVLVGNIPNNVLLDLMKKGILYDQVALKKWWNSPEAEPFRFRKGKI
jgi:hypothetical protein